MSLRVFCQTSLAVLALVVPVQAQFGAYPVVMDFDHNGAETQVLTVLSESPEPMMLRFYLGDFEQFVDGNHQFGALGAHPMTCQGRVSVSPESVELIPGGSAQVRVNMEPGAKTCWSALFAERATPEEEFKIVQRIAIKVHGHPESAHTSASVTEVSVVETEDERRVAVTIDNTGNTSLRPEGELELRTLDGDVVREIAIDPFSVLPGHRRTVQVVIPPDLPRGAFLAIPILDIGLDYLLGGQATFAVTGPEF